MSNTTAGPRVEPNPDAPRKRRVALRQSVWEAHQDMTADEIREFVDAVIREVEADAE